MEPIQPTQAELQAQFEAEYTCTLHERGESRVAVFCCPRILIENGQDTLDLLGSLSYLYECSKVVLRREHLTPDFFQLRTGIAGEVLQKFTNYGCRVAIVGDFSQEASQPLRDFIYECNTGKQVFFLPTELQALERLHSLC